MSRGDRLAVRETEISGTDEEEARSLLSHSSFDDDDPFLPPESPQDPPCLQPRPATKRQSSISQPPPNGESRTPRTPNRVRFDLDDDPEEEQEPNGHAHQEISWMNEEDYMSDGTSRSRRSSTGQLAPLLTNIEAPSVTLATSDDFFPEDHLESARPKSGLRSAFMNMANSIIGAGIIGQPYAFRQAGMTMGAVLLVILTVTVDWTIRLIVINSKLSGADSFQATVHFCFGRSGLIAISIAQWAFAFGGMIAFCIIVGDTIPHVMAAMFPKLREIPFLWLLTDRRAVIALFVIGISYPLSLYRDIAKLAKASTLALISMVIIVITVITQGFRVPPESRGDIKGSLFINTGFIQAVGVISFAFVCHHNSLLIYGSLKKPTIDRFALVTHYSTGISMVMCLVMAFAGFLTFGSKTEGNVLNNFPEDNIMVNIARFCFGLNMLATLPLEAFVCRSVMTTFYFPDEPYHPNRHLIFTTSLVVSSVILAIITCDLGAVFELIGATSACALAYILPPLCYIKLSQTSLKSKIPAMLCIVFGVTVMCTSIVQALIKILSTHVIVFLFFISLWIVDYWWTRQTRRGLPSAPKSPPQSANMARNADAAREERLKAMEIEALGTQRREILSTADAPNPFRRITTTQLELARAASQKGTEAQKLAEAHKTELTAWSEAWKTMGDETLEDLDDLMLGQTHRAQLTNAIQGTGGQEYNRAKGSLRGGPPRGGGGSRGRGVGRGGGAVGAHGHLTHARSLSLQARAANPRIIPEVPKIRKDPSLESSSKHTNEPPKRGKRPARPPTLRTRRVATPASRNYEALLADSSLFMAAVPAITASFNARPAQPQAAQPKVLVNDDEDRNTHPAVDPNVTENYDSVEEMSVDESTEQVRDEQHILESEDPEHPPEVQNPPRLRPLYVVFPIPSDNTGDTVADSDENKDINGFNTSVPQPLGRPRQSSLLIDLVADGDSVSKSDAPAFGNRGSHASVARPAPEKSLLDTTPEESKSLHPEKSPTLKSAKREPDVSCDATEFSNLLKEYGELEKIIAQSSSLAGPALEYLQLRQGQLRTQIAEKQAELLKSISNIRISEPKKEVVKASPQPETVQHVSRPVAQAHSQASVAKTVPPARLGGASDTKSLADKAHRPAPSTSGDVSAAVTSTYFPPPSHNIIGDHLLPGRYREPRQEAGTSTSSSEADEDESSRRLSPKTFFSSRKPSTDITRGSGHTRASQSVASIFDAPSRSVSSTAGTTAPPLVQERTTPSFPLTAATMQYSGASLNKTAGNAGSNRADSPPKQQAAKAAPKPPASSATIYGQKFSVPVHQPRTTSHVPMNAITRQYMGIGFDKNDTQSNEPTPTTTVPSRVNNVITRQYLGAVRSTNSGNQSNESTAASTTSPSHARRGSMNPQVSRHMSSPPKKPRHKRSPSKVSRSESFNSNNDTCNKGKSRAASGLQASKWAS